MNEADELPLRYKRCVARDHQVEEGAVPICGVNRLWVMPRDDVISEAPDRIQIPARRKELEGADTDVARRRRGSVPRRAWRSRQTGSPVVTAASARVVGIPSAAIASLTMYSRRTGPSAARPSPRRENGVGPDALELDVAAHAVAIDHLAEKDGTAVTELRHEIPNWWPA